MSLQILNHGLVLLQYLSRNSTNHMVALCENTKIGILNVERVMSFTGRNSLDVEWHTTQCHWKYSQQQHSLFLISATLYHRQFPILAIYYCEKRIVCSNGTIEL